MQRVNGLEEARAALQAGASALLSPPYAACHAGIGYYEALVARLKIEFPDTAFTLTLCCGDDPAIAHEAIRRGFASVVCSAQKRVLAKLRALSNAQVLAEYPQ